MIYDDNRWLKSATCRAPGWWRWRRHRGEVAIPNFLQAKNCGTNCPKKSAWFYHLSQMARQLMFKMWFTTCSWHTASAVCGWKFSWMNWWFIPCPLRFFHSPSQIRMIKPFKKHPFCSWLNHVTSSSMWFFHGWIQPSPLLLVSPGGGLRCRSHKGLAQVHLEDIFLGGFREKMGVPQ